MTKEEILAAIREAFYDGFEAGKSGDYSDEYFDPEDYYKE